MSAPVPLPDSRAVATLLGDLVMRGVTTKASSTTNIRPPGILGTYVHDDGQVCAACWMDLAAAASVGACLTLIPSGVVDESIRSGSLVDNLAENAREILNVCARLFTREGSPRVSLQNVTSDLPPDAAELIAKPRASLHLDLTVVGYRGGRISLLTK